EQRRRRLQKALGANGVEPEKPGEAEVRERVPIARAAPGGGVCRMHGEEARDRLVIAKQRGGVDIAARDLGVRGENLLRPIERAVPYRRVNEGGPGILASGLGFRHGSIIIARGQSTRDGSDRSRAAESRYFEERRTVV